MPYDNICLEAEEKMEKAVTVMTEEFKGVRTGRATPGLVENVRVEYYGSPTPLKQIAGISCPDPRMVMIKPFDVSAIGEIVKALQKSDLGINPQSDGKIVRLAIPPLSEDRRKQMAHMIKDMSEKARVAIRNIRRDANTHAEKEEKGKVLTEDELERTRTEIQRLTDEYVKKVDDSAGKKTKEVMEI